jgi:hypothetical protein
MINFLVFMFTCLVISFMGFLWGIYDSQKTYSLTKTEIIAGVKELLGQTGAKQNAPPPAAVDDAEKKSAPKPKDDEPSKFSLPKERVRMPQPVAKEEPKPPEPDPQVIRKQKADALTAEGDKFYSEGIQHLNNTYKRDNTFDKENELAMEKFRQAAKKYTEAQDFDHNNKALNTKVSEANQCIVTCRRQARRK